MSTWKTRRLWMRGPKRLWTRKCRDRACQESVPTEWHTAHLTRLSSWVLR